MTGIIHRRWIWLKRFRKRRGYGVHSPFAFNFLTYVVYEKGAYYAYKDLKHRYFCPAYLWNGHNVKCRKFLFRLANFVHPHVIELHGEMDDASLAYLTAGSSKSVLIRPADVTQVADDKDRLLVIGGDVTSDKWHALLKRITTERSVCMVTGIHSSKERLNAWKHLCLSEKVYVSFDLYDYGILFFDSSKQKQHYIVNF